MRNYLAIVFSDRAKAYQGLHALWQLDRDEEITVHGTTVVHRGALGDIHVDTKETHPAEATAIGVGVGAFLGLLAGPLGVVIGSAAGAAIGATVGATVGGVVGAVTDLDRADIRNQATFEAEFAIGIGQSAIIADVSESGRSAIDDEMRDLGGTVHRRARGSIADDIWFHGNTSLYPYEYIPRNESFW